MIESAAGETIAPPSPCRPRATSSMPSDCESPQISEAPEKSAIPATNSRRRPSRSASAPAEQEEPAEHQRVGVQDPGQALLREADVALDRRQRDVDHGRVQDDHELRDRDQRQHGVRFDT